MVTCLRAAMHFSMQAWNSHDKEYPFEYILFGSLFILACLQ